MPIRVLRLMEYTYRDVETMVADMDRWFVQGSITPSSHTKIKSTTLSPTVLSEGDEEEIG